MRRISGGGYEEDVLWGGRASPYALGSMRRTRLSLCVGFYEEDAPLPVRWVL